MCLWAGERTCARKKNITKPNMLICFSEPIKARTLSRSPTYAHIQLISKPKPKLKLKSKPKPTKQYRISPLTRLTVARKSRKRAKLWKTFGWKKRLAVCCVYAVGTAGAAAAMLKRCWYAICVFLWRARYLCAMCFTLCMYTAVCCMLYAWCVVCCVH